jgi:hypothetical protein
VMWRRIRVAVSVVVWGALGAAGFSFLPRDVFDAPKGIVAAFWVVGVGFGVWHGWTSSHGGDDDGGPGGGGAA